MHCIARRHTHGFAMQWLAAILFTRLQCNEIGGKEWLSARDAQVLRDARLKLREQFLVELFLQA